VTINPVLNPFVAHGSPSLINSLALNFLLS
jgi:hypothetical protein